MTCKRDVTALVVALVMVISVISAVGAGDHRDLYLTQSTGDSTVMAAQPTPPAGAAQGGSAEVKTSDAGDKSFVSPNTPTTWTQDDFRVFDMYGPLDCNLNGSDECIIAYENYTGASSELWLELVRWDGDTITVGPKVYVTDYVVNASVWVGDLLGTGVPVGAVAGTRDQAGAVGFIYVFTIGAGGAFSTETAEWENLHPDSTQTWYTDMMIADINTTSIQHEICITGFCDNATKYDGIVEIWLFDSGTLNPEDRSRYWVEGDATASIRTTALDVRDIKDSTDLEVVTVGFYQKATTQGWIDLFHSSDYPFSGNNGYSNQSMLFGADVSRLYDVRVGAFDYDSTANKICVVGFHQGSPDSLVGVLNWTGATPGTEYLEYIVLDDDGDDYSQCFEVELAPTDVWDTAPILVIFGWVYDTAYNYYYMYWNYTYATPMWIHNETGTSDFTLYFYWAELMIGDGGADGDADSDNNIELWCVWNYDLSGLGWTRETDAWPILYDTESAPTSEPAGPPGKNREPSTGRNADAPKHTPWAPDPWVATIWDQIWWSLWTLIGLALLTALFLVKAVREKREKLTPDKLSLLNFTLTATLTALLATVMLTRPEWLVPYSSVCQSSWDALANLWRWEVVT